MYSSKSVDDVLTLLGTSAKGLSELEISKVRKEEGWNELPQKPVSLWKLVLAQFQDILIYILLGALVLSVVAPFFEGETVHFADFFDAIAILAILILNAVLGFVQEYKAERAIESLQKLSSPHARVRRDGEESIIPSRELVPGDIVIVEAGDRISADGRLITVSHLQINESSMTGESQPETKGTEPVAEGESIADQTSMVFSGTLVTRGSGEYVVTAIGLKTHLGAIADLVMQTEQEQTPLQERLARLSKSIGFIVLALCALLFVFGFIRGFSLIEMLMIGISLAVSAVPEGLPAVMTVCLAIGVRRMVQKNVIVRKLQAIETLGSVTVLCSDKTGTITENRMHVADSWVDVPSSLPEAGEGRALLAQIGASCNKARLPEIGDPTEVGLLRYAEKKDVARLEIVEEEVPFSSEDKFMQTAHEVDGKRVSYMKGAPEVIVDKCDVVHRDTVLRKTKEMASHGLRVLACAVTEDGKTRFVGLLGLEDPPREGVQEAIAVANKAGIRTMMITGDNLDTALAIAERVGIEPKGIEGRDLEGMTPGQLESVVQHTSVYARVSPVHKLTILKTLQKLGEVVAMSGDGVNDAPALKGAHVGVAMGKNGTEVAREASSIVLTDDNYATMVTAVREGRHLYDNIRKFILYLMRTNFYMLLLFAAVIVLGLPLPYLPLHILWINLMTDGLPALALGLEPAEPDIMDRPPRPRGEHIFAGQWGKLIIAAVVGGSVSLLLFLWQLSVSDSIEQARSVLFTFAIVFEACFTFTVRSRKPVWEIGFFSNKWLLGAISIPLVLQFVLLYTPVNQAFDLQPLGLEMWGVVVGLAVGITLLFELVKVVFPKRA